MSKPKSGIQIQDQERTDVVVIRSLRIALYTAIVLTESGASPQVIKYRGRIQFPQQGAARGIRELFSTVEVEGEILHGAWAELTPYHASLIEPDQTALARVEVSVSNAYLWQPRAWVTQTEAGIVAKTILRIQINAIERARFPGYRWRRVGVVRTEKRMTSGGKEISSRSTKRTLH